MQIFFLSDFYLFMKKRVQCGSVVKCKTHDLKVTGLILNGSTELLVGISLDKHY